MRIVPLVEIEGRRYADASAAHKLRVYRQLLGIPVPELCKECGMSDQQYYNRETGKTLFTEKEYSRAYVFLKRRCRWMYGTEQVPVTLENKIRALIYDADLTIPMIIHLAKIPYQRMYKIARGDIEPTAEELRRIVKVCREWKARCED